MWWFVGIVCDPAIFVGSCHIYPTGREKHKDRLFFLCFAMHSTIYHLYLTKCTGRFQIDALKHSIFIAC